MGDTSWDKDPYTIAHVNISASYGSHFPEGTDMHTDIIDVCPECWKAVVVPFFTGLGAKVREEDIDW
jgi:hypothetical protein